MATLLFPKNEALIGCTDLNVLTLGEASVSNGCDSTTRQKQQVFDPAEDVLKTEETKERIGFGEWMIQEVSWASSTNDSRSSNGSTRLKQ